MIRAALWPPYLTESQSIHCKAIHSELPVTSSHMSTAEFLVGEFRDRYRRVGQFLHITLDAGLALLAANLSGNGKGSTGIAFELTELLPGFVFGIDSRFRDRLFDEVARSLCADSCDERFRSFPTLAVGHFLGLLAAFDGWVHS